MPMEADYDDCRYAVHLDAAARPCACRIPDLYRLCRPFLARNGAGVGHAPLKTMPVVNV